MKKIVAYFRKLFYSSYIGYWYFTFTLWLDRKKFEKEIKNRPRLETAKIVQNAVQEKYEQGLKVIKGKVNELVKVKDKVEYDRVLKELEDLTVLSTGEQKLELEALKKVYLYNGQDVKTELDKIKMINKRIQDFEQLKKHKEQREKLRLERKKVNNGH